MSEPKPTNPEETPQTRRELLPAVTTHPLTLLITIAVPQIALLILNWRSYYLISDEVDTQQRGWALLLFTTELILLIGGSLMAGRQWYRRKPIPWSWNWLIFVPHVAHLVLVTTKTYEVIPSAMQTWILPPESVVFYQFVFLMPAIFLSALRLACFPITCQPGKDIGISVLCALGIPFFWFLAVNVGHGVLFNKVNGTVIFAIVAITSLICLTGVLRLLTMLFIQALNKGPKMQFALAALFGLVAPIGGLLLNQRIPFPADFQIWPVYALTILNGILLTLPYPASEPWRRIFWLAQCALFPFTLYFFFLFLPYLPLAVIAIIAAGAGFLILSPTALFILHLRKLYRGLPSAKAIPLGIVAALILPAYAQIEMIVDRSVLHQVINYVYSPRLEGDINFSGNPATLKRSLLRLQTIKDGVYLPFLTEWYNESVLDGLVLNDEKMSHLYHSFFGEGIPPTENQSGSLFGMRASRSTATRRISPPPQHAVVSELTHSVTTETKEGTRTLVKLELHNPSDQQSEFSTTIDLPTGVFVSGYWLNVEDERVPGQIFEKKTAMWVYRMIRDSRRDPGLLTYLSPNELSLRVFPFAAGQTRITEIEFLSPPGVNPEIRIGGRKIQSEPNDPEITITRVSESMQSVQLSGDNGDQLPATLRRPYFHFIVDRSATGLSSEQAVAEMHEVLTTYPQIEHFTLTTANYEVAAAGSHAGLFETASLESEECKRRIEELPLRGAFLAETAMKHALVQFQEQQENFSSEHVTTHYPILVQILGNKTFRKSLKNLNWYQSITPDTHQFWVKLQGSSEVAAKSFLDQKVKAELSPKPITLFRAGKSLTALPAESASALGFLQSTEPLQVYSATENQFIPVTATNKLPASSHYARANQVHRLDQAILNDPSRATQALPEIVAESRRQGILVPSTAYMVVENSAQWKILKRKESEKLKSNQELDFMEAPEPGMIYVAAGFLAFLLLKRRLLHRKLETTFSSPTKILPTH